MMCNRAEDPGQPAIDDRGRGPDTIREIVRKRECRSCVGTSMSFGKHLFEKIVQRIHGAVLSVIFPLQALQTFIFALRIFLILGLIVFSSS